MREKYIDERWPDLMTHGVNQQGEHYVTDTHEAIDVPMSFESAQAVVAHYNKLKAEFVEMIQAFNKADENAFNQFWYNRGN